MILSLIASVALVFAAENGTATLKRIEGQAPLGYIEIQGVKAGNFSPSLWQTGKVPLLPDVRSPLLAPRLSGGFRNIYAPSVVETPGGWRVFYGAWDGVATGNDRIYSTTTADFIDFGPRETVIEHGGFIHACNVNALRHEDGRYEMVCTVYPDTRNRNKPAYFSSPDGKVWNGVKAPYPATLDDIVSIQGYENYPDADINGMNVILREGDALRLYFNNFKDFGRVYRATGQGGREFTIEGVALECPYVVNDVKKFHAKDPASENSSWYLMGLHMNREGLWYSLSQDGLHFAPEQPLLTHLGPEDRYIVALGWVAEGNRLLGTLYGAGAVKELNRNRIFARWLQRRVVFVSDDGTRCEPETALGPDRQLIRIPEGVAPQGHFEVFAEDGSTPQTKPIPAKVHSGMIFRLDRTP